MSQAQIIPAVSPSVSLINGRPATTSLDVAKFFGKRHDNVVRSIQDLISNCPKEFTALNFEVSEYTDETGRTLLMYTVYEVRLTPPPPIPLHMIGFFRDWS